MGSIDSTNGFSNGLSNGSAKGQLKPAKGGKPRWGFDTLQVHAGLEDSPRYGHITLPIYNTASFKFNKLDDLNHALEDISSSQNHLYTRVSNVSLGMNDLEQVLAVLI
jgi:O-acetylhomoserine/O-acetylserine sulfhydrylase